MLYLYAGLVLSKDGGMRVGAPRLVFCQFRTATANSKNKAIETLLLTSSPSDLQSLGCKPSVMLGRVVAAKAYLAPEMPMPERLLLTWARSSSFVNE